MTDYSIAGGAGSPLSNWASPTRAGKLALVDPSDTTTAPASSTGSDKWASIGQLLGVAGYVFPSGDATGAADVTAINNIIANGGACVLAWTGTNWGGGQTPFQIGTPLLPATGSSLTGAAPWMSSEADLYGAGTGTSGGSVLITPATFSGAAVISLDNTTGTQAHGVTLKNFAIDGASVQPAGHGILVHGAWGACVFEGIAVNGPFADCLHFEADATTTFGPDDFRVSGCKFSASFTGYGVWGDNVPDSWFTDCESSENALDNWWLGFSLNTRLSQCKGENSKGGAGFHLTGQGGAGRFITLTACSTHVNNGDGFLFDGTSSGSTGGDYLLGNCVSVDDGQAGGTTFAGFRSSGSVNRVIGSNCKASGAPNGASQVSTSTGMDFIHSTFSGVTANLHDDGSNTTPLVSRNSPDSPHAVLRTAFTTPSSASAQNVTGMAVALQPGTYKVTGYFPTHQTAGTGTLKIAWTFGGTISAAVGKWLITQGTAQVIATATSVTTQTLASSALSSGSIYLAEYTADVTVTVAGTLQLQTQASATGTQVQFPVGSYVDAELVA